MDLDRIARDAVSASLAEIAIAAGPAVMEVYATGGSVSSKSDGSPVTLADERAEAIICDRLARLLPDDARCRGGGDRSGTARRDRPTVSCSSTRSTGPRNSLRETASSPSTSRWSRAASRSPVRSTRRPSPGSGSAASACSSATSRSGQACRSRRLARDPDPRRARAPRRPGEPVPRRRRDRGVPGPAAGGRASLRRLVAEVLPRRRRAGGRLPAVRADDGVGYRGWRRRASRRRRGRARPVRRPARLWKRQREAAQRAVRRLGRPRRARPVPLTLIIGQRPTRTMIRRGESSPRRSGSHPGGRGGTG